MNAESEQIAKWRLHQKSKELTQQQLQTEKKMHGKRKISRFLVKLRMIFPHFVLFLVPKNRYYSVFDAMNEVNERNFSRLVIDCCSMRLTATVPLLHRLDSLIFSVMVVWSSLSSSSSLFCSVWIFCQFPYPTSANKQIKLLMSHRHQSTLDDLRAQWRREQHVEQKFVICNFDFS